MARPRTIMLPVRGVSDRAPFFKQPGDTCPPAAMRNVLPHPTGKRRQLGKRPGQVRLATLGTTPVQAVASVVRARTPTGYTVGDCEDLGSGVSKEADALSLNAWLLDDVPSMCASVGLDATDAPFNATSNAAAVACAVNDAGTRFAYAVNIPNSASASGFGQSIVRILEPDGTILGTYHLATAGVDRFVNTLEFCTDRFGVKERLVCASNDRLLVLDAADASLMGEHVLNNWAYEVIEARAWTDPADGTVYLFACFLGASGPGTLFNGQPILSGQNARHFRAGVMKLHVTSPVAPLIPTGLTQTGWGTKLVSGDPFFESDHRYHRFSEHWPYAPWGRHPTAMAIDPQRGDVWVATCNQGRGPNSTYEPDGLFVPYVTLYRINAAGTFGTIADTNSILEIGAGGYLNDIPIGPGDEPSIQALAVDAEGSVYAAGRSNAAGLCVFKLTREGGRVWAQNLMGAFDASVPHVTIRQAAIAIDPADGNVILGGDRNSDWDGAASREAHLWKLAAADGAVVWHYDIDEAVSALALAVATDGSVLYGTDPV